MEFNMFTKKVYFLIETKKRELNSQLTIVNKLINKNIECYIVSKKQFLSKCDVIEPGIILFKSIGTRNIEIIKFLKKLGHKLACLDSEGLSILNKKQILERVDVKNLNELEYFFCWGNYSLNIIRSFYPEYKKKLITTGNPKFDIIKNYSKNKIFNKEVTEINKKYPEFILFLTMFTVVNPLKRYGFTDKKQSLETIGFKRDKKLIELGKKFYNFQAKNLDFFLKSIVYVSEKFPNKLIIVRPHPTENIEFWKNKLKKYKNIKVIYDVKDTISWLISSEINFSINCTTSLESYFLNKISYNLVEVNEKDVEYDWILNTSKKISSLKLIDKIIKNKKNIIIKKPNLHLVDILYNFGIKTDSANKISSHIAKICFLSIKNKTKFHRYYKSKVFKFLKKIKLLKEDIIYKQKIDKIDVKEVKEKMSLIRKKNNFIVDELYPDFIRVYKK